LAPPIQGNKIVVFEEVVDRTIATSLGAMLAPASFGGGEPNIAFRISAML